jgi:hypothetical protein
VGCGKIGRIALDSFHKYHDHQVHVYGTPDDFAHIIPHPNNILIEVDPTILKGYVHGHVGTALLWEQIIKNCPSTYMLHFDSDVIFRQNIVEDMIALTPEYDLIGPIRNYHHNPHNNPSVRYLTDICQTNCTLWNKDRISPQYISGKTSVRAWVRNIATLSPLQLARRIKWQIKHLLGTYQMSRFAQMIHGTYNPFPFPTIDFFDPVMFDMVKNGASIYHLDFDEVGGCNYFGKRDNVFKEINNFPTQYKLDFGTKLVHFSCVGSGMNFYHHPDAAANVPRSYVDAALDRYALFCKIFYTETLPEISTEQYGPIIRVSSWY